MYIAQTLGDSWESQVAMRVVLELSSSLSIASMKDDLTGTEPDDDTTRAGHEHE
jgi:hypothetical protein